MLSGGFQGGQEPTGTGDVNAVEVLLAPTPDHASGVNYSASFRCQLLQCGGIVQVTLYECDTQVGQLLCVVRIADQCAHLVTLLQ